MADRITPEERSRNMSAIKSRDTTPEEIVRKYLFAHGFRYRKNVKTLPGTPDIVLPKYRTVIFVNGCFWHKHNCKRFRWPKSNAEFWREKITKNVERDLKNNEALENAGWEVLTVWECEIKENKDDVMNEIITSLRKKK